jgi:hypothetical protein
MLWAVGLFEAARVCFFPLTAAPWRLVVSVLLPDAAFVFALAVDCLVLAVDFFAVACFFVFCVEATAAPVNGTIPISKTPTVTATLAFIQLLNSTSLVLQP